MRIYFFILIYLLLSFNIQAQQYDNLPNFGAGNYYYMNPSNKVAMQELSMQEEALLIGRYKAIVDQVGKSKTDLNRAIDLLHEEKYKEAIDTLEITRSKFEFLSIPAYIDLTNIYLAFAYHKLDDSSKSNFYLKKLNYRNQLPDVLQFSGNLYYWNGEKKKAVKLYKRILKQDKHNFEICTAIYYIYKDDLNAPHKANTYKTMSEEILKNKKNETRPRNDLTDEINEMKKVN